jgi:peptide/nickel transport system permease protein
MASNTDVSSTEQGTPSLDAGIVAPVQLKQEEFGVGDSLTTLALRRLRRDYLTMAAMLILFSLAFVSYIVPLAIPMDYTTTAADTKAFLPPNSPDHLLGTDSLGRDHLARLLYAGRVSLGIGFFAGTSSILLGASIGLVAGYYQGSRLGFLDDLINWFITTLNSIPSLLLLILLSSVLSPSIPTLVAVLVLISWSGTMRLVRGETLSHREREYVVSARAVGVRDWRIMFVHILPNVFSVFIVSLALSIGSIILVEAALSFVGLGVRPPEPSWGNMLTDAQKYTRDAVFLSIYPGVLIVTTVLCFYLLGDGLRDAFDPQSNKKT